ncbi:MAG: ABC transporter ATP-binding protein [Eubacteriales bacterium]|nr:ABC transporter ATP-binding protein [Eubacteriales bacterium]MDD4324401.1 ABC transporter ATP-binding protein [Eubacteriales bacterium]MDD4540723.1 ABC transporter ATP-binding protein [Eubacteriales bacterium]
MESTSIFEVSGLSKSFAGLKAVDNVSMKIKTGEILGLIGPNGSGKTTFINLVTGMLEKDAGRITIDQHNIGEMQAYQIPVHGLVRTYQTIRLFKHLSSLENVMIGALGVGMKRKQAAAVAEDLLEELGLSERRDAPAQGLTFRDQRLLEIARALAAKPRFLLLDEPAAGLNEEETDELFALLSVMPEQKNIGILIVDHDMRLIMNLCNRLHVLNYGQTIAEGKPEDVRRNPEVVVAYLGSEAS